MRQYSRDDIDYDDWYNPWMKTLAKQRTKSELDVMVRGVKIDNKVATESHLRAVSKTTSMTSNSQRRAQTRNVVAATGDYAIAISGAIEIHELFPEYARGSIGHQGKRREDMREQRFKVMYRGRWCTFDINLGITEFGYSAYMSCIEKGEPVYEFTSLKSDGGKGDEMCEGDVVKTEYYTGVPGKFKRIVGVIEYRAPSFVVCGVKQYEGMVKELTQNSKILGNCHENPELLKS